MSAIDRQTVSTLVSEERAKLLRVVETSGYDTALERFWDGIEKDQLDACRKHLRAQSTVKNPLASGDAKTGEWACGPVEDRRQEDGTFVVIQTLYRGNLVISSFIAEDSCSYTVERTLYFKSKERPSLPAKPYPRGVSYRMSELIVDGALGTFTGWVDKRTRTTQTLSDMVVEASPVSSTSQTERLGVTASNIATSYPDPTVETGKVKQRRIGLNSDCSADIVDTTETATPKSTGAYASGGPLVVESETVDINQSSPVAPGAGAAGVINSARNTINRFGLYDRVLTTRTAQPKASTAYTATRTKSATRLTIEYRNQADQLDAPSLTLDDTGAARAVTATEASARNSINEFGLYDGDRSVTIPTLPPTGSLGAGLTDSIGIYYSHGEPRLVKKATTQDVGGVLDTVYVSKWIVHRYKHEVKYFATESEGYAFITSTATPRYLTSSFVREVEGGVFRAERISVDGSDLAAIAGTIVGHTGDVSGAEFF